MHFSMLLHLVSLLVVGSTARSLQLRYVVHESRKVLPSGFVTRERLNPTVRLPLRIGLKQRNLHLASQLLDQVSHPQSDTYAKYWTPQEVVDTFSPSEESFDAVTSWLTESGIDSHHISVTPNKAWVEVNATVREAEDLLRTQYYIYDHSLREMHVGCQSYSLPEDLSANHVDIILPSVHFDAQLSPPKVEDLLKRQATTPAPIVEGGSVKNVGQFNDSLPKPGPLINVQAIQIDATTCDQYIVPDCLRLLYNFGTGSLNLSSYGIVEYTPQAYLPEDLDLFFTNFSSDLVGERPIFAPIQGGVLQTEVEGFSYNGESNLDLEYAMAIVSPQAVTLYQVGDLVQGASFNNFLDGIDASYCTFEGGDDPDFDGIYPDPLRGGYKAQDCGLYTPASVISVSYGYNEVDLTPSYEQRQCAEYMKLALQGVTVLYSSGDNGVAGNGAQCLNEDGTLNDGDTGIFTPSFPGGCPYITSVGATQVPTGVDVAAAVASGTQPEVACETVIYSGGGFSNVFEIPSYQADAVASYLTNYPPPYSADLYNSSGLARAFPDVSANGANYIITVTDEFGLVFGTSASSPTFGGIITLINEELIAAGKSPVGFINPVLYANPDVLTDVVNGTNPGCGTSGFDAQPGWDPVTGLGTPNYEKMLALFQSLQ